jgi:hypothetical protein
VIEALLAVLDCPRRRDAKPRLMVITNWCQQVEAQIARDNGATT